jgi:putative transposase
MPWSLLRFHQTGQLHFITFSCYRRRALLSPQNRVVFEQALERMRRKYGFFVSGYVVMPEHVHLLMSEPERSTLASALQGIKQSVSLRIGTAKDAPFWQARYYDFNVFSEQKRIQKLRYMHRNPVERGLCERPEDWEWSSFRQYATGCDGRVEIESRWTARRREKKGLPLTVK